MATTSFSESFKYGSRLFGLFVVILLVGGGGVGLGGALAIPEIQAWRDSGSVETAAIAGGLILAVVGLSILIIGQFAIIYKLIADGVSKGNADPAVEMAAGPVEADTAEDSKSQAPSESAPPEPQQPPETTEAEPPQEPAGPQPESASQPNPEPTEPAATEGQPPAEASQPAESPPADQQDSPTQPEAEKPNEQTAEEIVFGSSEVSADEGSEVPEEIDEESQQSRENVETAGGSGSDPLADNFDDE